MKAKTVQVRLREESMDSAVFSVVFSCVTAVILFNVLPLASANHWSEDCTKFCNCFSTVDSVTGTYRKNVDCSEGRFPTNSELKIPADTDSLNLSGNRLSLSDILMVVDTLVELRYLNLSNNAIWGVRQLKSFRSPVNILDISKNSISSLPADWLFNREYLDILNVSNNKIEFIHPAALSYMGKLKYLDLSHNGLGQLHKKWFHDLTKLETLDLSYNFIKSLPSKVFQHLGSLTMLDLSHNRIRTIDLGAFLGIANVEYLYLNENRLTDGITEELERLHQVKVLDVSNNDFRRFDTHAFINVKVQHLIIQKEKHLRFVRREAFVNMPVLVNLEMTNNPLLEYIDHNAFLNVPMIETLHLEGNKLRAVSNQTITSLASLQRLFIKGNPIVCDCNVHWLLVEPKTNLQIVDLNDTVCHGPTLVTGRLLSQSLRWYVPSLCRPEIVSDFSQKSFYLFGQTIELECYALGNPSPDIYWIFTKENKLDFCSPNDTETIHPIQSGGRLRIQPLTFDNSGHYKCVAQNTQGRTEKCFDIVVEGNSGEIVILRTTEESVEFTWRGTNPKYRYKILYRQNSTNHSNSFGVKLISPGMRNYGLTNLNSSTLYEICIALITDKGSVDRKCSVVSTANEKLHSRGIYSVKTLVMGLSIGCVVAIVTCSCLVWASIKKYNKSKGNGQYMLPQSTSRQRIMAHSEGRSSVGTPTTYENKMLELSDEECFIEESEASFSEVVT